MPLPEEVINRLSQERPPRGEWASGLLGFAAALLAVTVLLYAGIAFIYQPYVDGQSATVAGQLTQAGKAIQPDQEAALLASYSALTHVRVLLTSRTVFSPVLTWLSEHTQANTYYSSLSFSSGKQLMISVLSRSEADLNQQIALFEADPAVAAANVTNISPANVSGYIEANVVLVLKPALLSAGQ